MALPAPLEGRIGCRAQDIHLTQLVGSRIVERFILDRYGYFLGGYNLYCDLLAILWFFIVYMFADRPVLDHDFG